jgi:hypothetical protein
LKPGLSSYESDPPAAGESLTGLLEFAKKHVPESHRAQTPIYLYATAGLRNGTILNSAIPPSSFNFQSISIWLWKSCCGIEFFSVQPVPAGIAEEILEACRTKLAASPFQFDPAFARLIPGTFDFSIFKMGLDLQFAIVLMSDFFSKIFDVYF